jgi:hypothetical protein
MEAPGVEQPGLRETIEACAALAQARADYALTQFPKVPGKVPGYAARPRDFPQFFARPCKTASTAVFCA